MADLHIKTLSINPASQTLGNIYLKRAADFMGHVPVSPSVRYTEGCRRTVNGINWWLPTRFSSMGLSMLSLVLRVIEAGLLAVCGSIIGDASTALMLYVFAAAMLAGIAVRPVAIAVAGCSAGIFAISGLEFGMVEWSAALFAVSVLLALFGPGRISLDAPLRRSLVKDARRRHSLRSALVNI